MSVEVRSPESPTAEGIGALVRRLRAFQKPNRGAPAYSRFVNRPAGRLIAAVAFRLGLTPNQVTAVSALLSLAGILVLAVSPVGVTTGLVVAALLALGYAFDSADGQLARLRGGGTPAGEWLDHVVDCVKISLLHVAVAVALYRLGAGPWSLALPLAYLVVANLFFFSYILTDQLKRVLGTGASPGGGPAEGRAPVLRSVLTLPTDYGLLCVVFLLWGVTPVFLVTYGILLVGNAAYVVAGLPKWYRDIARATAPSR